MQSFLGNFRDLQRQILENIQRHFVPKPIETCSCGKSVVFRHPATTYRCSRCGERYRLVVKIEKIIPWTRNTVKP